MYITAILRFPKFNNLLIYKNFYEEKSCYNIHIDL